MLSFGQPPELQYPSLASPVSWPKIHILCWPAAVLADDSHPSTEPPIRTMLDKKPELLGEMSHNLRCPG
jgi:hypothetical protein